MNNYIPHKATEVITYTCPNETPASTQSHHSPGTIFRRNKQKWILSVNTINIWERILHFRHTRNIDMLEDMLHESLTHRQYDFIQHVPEIWIRWSVTCDNTVRKQKRLSLQWNHCLCTLWHYSCLPLDKEEIIPKITAYFSPNRSKYPEGIYSQDEIR